MKSNEVLSEINRLCLSYFENAGETPSNAATLAIATGIALGAGVGFHISDGRTPEKALELASADFLTSLSKRKDTAPTGDDTK